MTVTDTTVIISYTKQVRLEVPTARVGLDLNEKSAVCSYGTNYDLAEVARLHTEHGVRRRDLYQRHPNDRRLKKQYAASSREKERVRQILHKSAKEIVESAREKGQVIVLERLNGIRRAHNGGNWEAKSGRRRITQWPFRLLQTYIIYKASWSGVHVELASAAWTSQACCRCGHVNRKLKVTEREWRCPNCGATLDRDLNAAINIERRGKIPCLGEVRPGAQGKDEAVKGNATTTANPPSRSPEVSSASPAKLTEPDTTESASL